MVGVRPVRLDGMPRASMSSLMRPSFLLVLMYSVAICFERIVEVEVFKPYRLIGLALIFAALLKGRLRMDGIARPVLLYIAIGAVLGVAHVLLTSVPPEGLVVGTVLWLFNIATYIAVCTLLRNQREVMIALGMHALAMVFASFDILQNSAELLAIEGASIRVTGDFKNPAHACLSMLVATLIMITFMRSFIARKSGLGSKVLIFSFGTAIALFELYVASLTGSRAGAIQFLVGVMVYSALVGWRRVAMGLLVVGVLGFAVSTQWNSWFEQQRSNILVQRAESKGLENDRYYLWRSGLDAYIDSYGMGVGIGQYRVIHQDYFRTYENIGDGRMADKKLSLHSDYVTALVEFGTAGIIIYLVLWRRIWGSSKRIVDANVRAMAMAMVVAALTVAVTHAVLTYMGLWLYLAMISSWVRFESVASRQGVAAS